MKTNKWLKRWKVEGSNGHNWIVAVDKDNNYGCSCPVWKFKRQECHHIKQIKINGGNEITKVSRPEYVLAKVNKPIYDEQENRLYCPLVGIPDVMLMEATICYYLLKHGYSMSEIRNMRGIPSDWTAKAIYNYIEKYGETEYPKEWYEK